MRKRDTFILVALAHVGLILIWVCMGGCAGKGGKSKEVIHPEKIEIPEEEPITDTSRKVKEVEPVIITEETMTIETVKETTAPETTKEIKYIVKEGDSLWKISRKFGVTVDAIADRNDIQDTKLIRVGRELWIPVGKVPVKEVEKEVDLGPAIEGKETVETTTETAETTETVTTETTEEPTIPTEEGDFIIHVVERGDTIWKLARTYGTTSAKIMELNNITDPKSLQIGQKLRIPK